MNKFTFVSNKKPLSGQHYICEHSKLVTRVGMKRLIKLRYTIFSSIFDILKPGKTDENDLDLIATHCVVRKNKTSY